MPVGSPAFIADSRTNVANVAPQHELFVNETYPQIIPSYWQSISAESGGTQLESMECARLVIGSASGNHLMFIGGLDQSAPCSGRGTPLYPGQAGEREMFIENSNRVRICATFSGELVYYMGYINGQPTSVNPSTQGVQPNNQPPQLLSTTPLSGQHNISFTTSGTSFISIFDENIASGSFDTESYTVRLSGDFSTFLSGETSYHQTDDAEDRTQLQFIPYSGQLVGSSYYNVYIGTRISDDPGSTIPSTLTWSFVTAGVDPVPMVLKSHEPVSGAASVLLNSTITATFNKAVSGIVNQTGFGQCIYLWKDSDGPTVGISGVLLLDDDTSGKKLIFTPDIELTPLTLYRYSISGIIDSFENTITPKSGIAFATTIADTQGPVVSGIFVSQGGSGYGQLVNAYDILAAGATVGNIFNGTNIVISFNEPISGIPGAPVSGNIISLWVSGTPGSELSGAITLDPDRTTLTFNPDIDLTNSGRYEVRVSGVKDLNNNFITQTFPSRSGIAFYIWGEVDLVPPSVNTITPVSGSVGNAVNSNIVVNMSELISGTAGAGFMAGIQPIAIFLSGTGNIAGDITLSADQTRLTFDPTANLSGDRTYYVSVSGLMDGGSNTMNPKSGHSFRTIDNIPPVISGISPVSGFPDFNVNDNIVVTFSEAISGTPGASTMPGFSGVIVYFSGTTFTTATKVGGSCSLSIDRTQLTFNPTSQLAADDYFLITVTGVVDVSGNTIAHPGTGAIRTSGNAFKTAAGPIITATNPASGATNVALGNDVTIAFNKALTGVVGTSWVDPVVGLVLSGTPNVNQPGDLKITNAAKTQLTYNPNAALASNKTYYLNVSGIRDENNVLISQTSPPRSGIAFTTQTIDTSPPAITSTVPTSGAVDVAVNTDFVVNFSETISGTVAESYPIETVRVYICGAVLPGGYLAGTVTKTAATQLTFNPTLDLSGDRWYKTFVTGVYDLAGNVLNQTTGALRQSGAFRTIDNIAPTLVSITPADAATNVNVGTTITATMSEVCSGNAGSIAASIFTLVKTAVPGTTLGGSTTLDSTLKIFTFTPSTALAFNTPHTVTVANIRDLKNNIMTQNTTTFTTAGQPLTTFYDVTGSTERKFFFDSGSINKRAGEKRATTSSSMNNKVIKRATFALRRFGTPGGTLRVRIRANTESGDTVAVLFDTILNANDVSTTKTRYTFEKLDNTYGLTTNDAILVELDGATQSSSNTIAVYYTDGTAYNGSNSIYVSYDTDYTDFDDRDIDAKFEE